jgi:hypothetical protein
MALTINRFISEVTFENNFNGEGGLAKGSHFEVRMSFPTQLNVSGSLVGPAETENLTLRCDSISFPSRAALTSNIKYFGPEKRMVYGYDGAPVTATVLLSQNMFERELFLKWQDLALGNARQRGSGHGFAQSFLVGYYKQYTADVQIIKYNDAGIKTATTSLIEAFPAFVGEVGTDWGSDEILKVNVTFNYRYFTDQIRGGVGPDPVLAGLFQAAVNGNLDREAREVASEAINTGIRKYF